MAELNDICSVLKLNRVYFEKISFVRETSKSDAREGSVEFEIEGPSIHDESFTMLVSAHAAVAGLYRLDVTLHGDFSISGGLNDDNMYLTTNAVAILFPYLRSQLTLLTTQPGLSPIILPPINVNKLMKQHNEKQS